MSSSRNVSATSSSVPDKAIPAATGYLEYLADRGDPFVRHLFGAPEEDKCLSDAGSQLIDEAYDDIVNGRLYGRDELKREFSP